MAAIEKIVEGDGVITVYFNLSISQSHILLAGLLQLPLRGGGGQCQGGDQEDQQTDRCDSQSRSVDQSVSQSVSFFNQVSRIF